MKRYLVTAAKLIVALGLLLWLSHSDKLDFGQLRIFIDAPSVLAFNVALWAVGYVCLGTLRWRLLMQSMGLKIGYLRAVQLQLIGLFFNTAVPGAVGGDVVKAVYVIREQKGGGKTAVLLTVLLDRIIGLVSLICMAALAIGLNYRQILDEPKLQPLAAFTFIALGAVVVGLVCVFFPFAPGRDPFLRLWALKVPGFSLLGRVYSALRSFGSQPMVLVKCLAISIVIQSIALPYTWYVGRILTGQELDFSTFAVIFPLGVISTAVPLAPGGLGVGHAAFDGLFQLVGWTGGANVFNVTTLGSMSLYLLGVFPYLWARSKAPIAKDEYDALLKDSTNPAHSG